MANYSSRSSLHKALVTALDDLVPVIQNPQLQVVATLIKQMRLPKHNPNQIIVDFIRTLISDVPEITHSAPYDRRLKMLCRHCINVSIAPTDQPLSPRHRRP